MGAERDPRFVIEDLEVDVANWKQRYEEAQKLLSTSGSQWEATIRDRDIWKARALAAEAAIARVTALVDQPDNPIFRMHNAEPFPRLFSRAEIRAALEGGA